MMEIRHDELDDRPDDELDDELDDDREVVDDDEAVDE